ncbi:MAG: histidine kinase [Chitinophagaceae bacterium]|nr:histidine kinase [Chitinophagaceae bacterium]
MKSVWYNKKGWVVLIHAVIWTGLFCLPFLLRPHDDNGQQHTLTLPEIASYIVSNLLWVIFFYVNALLLVPKLLSRNFFARYIIALLIGFCVIAFLQAVFFLYLSKADHFNLLRHIIFNFLIFLFFLASSIAYRLIIDKNRADNLARDKETESLKTELSLLRSQASPHFLFNVLNNMVALARKKSDLLEPSLIKLSSLIRYTVYETLEETVELEKEIDYLESYIDLQQQRFGSNVQFSISLQRPHQNLHIEPMLLIPFVENAIKHGTGFIENAEINIQLSTTEKNLLFFVRNKYNAEDNEIKDKTSGIGLANVRRRLNLLYPHSHQLQIEKKDGWFTVVLKLILH